MNNLVYNIESFSFEYKEKKYYMRLADEIELMIYENELLKNARSAILIT